MSFKAVFLIAFVLVWPVLPARADTEFHVSYAAYSHFFHIMNLDASFALSPARYHLQINYHTTGFIGALFQGHQQTSVDGVWVSNRPQPLWFADAGYWRGQWRRVLIDYDRGQPIVRTLAPENDTERDPIPPQMERNTVDTLSPMLLLMRRVAETGRCETSAQTFDGRRVAEITARTVGMENLEPTRRSTFSGPALRCDFEGRQVAGFVRDVDRNELMRPQRGSAWFANLIHGAPPVPVRISFETRWFGEATMYIAAEGPGFAGPRR
ncbi:MAG: DUF3108 domain-containing protein [Acetobacteraceae bacterium]|nr:DUF3108 domain-containing protein [Acetobacteraceae bacterium]